MLLNGTKFEVKINLFHFFLQKHCFTLKSCFFYWVLISPAMDKTLSTAKSLVVSSVYRNSVSAEPPNPTETLVRPNYRTETEISVVYYQTL